MINISGIPLPHPPQKLPPLLRYGGLNELNGTIRFYIGVNLAVDEMRDWSTTRITDFFNGIAQIITARGNVQ